MANVNGVNSTAYAKSGIANLVTKAFNNSLMSVHDEYKAPAANLEAASVITMGTVPKGAKVVGFVLWTNGETSSAITGTIKVGTTTASAAKDLETAASFFEGAIGGVSNTALTADTAVTITTSAEVLVEDHELSLTTLYIMDN